MVRLYVARAPPHTYYITQRPHAMLSIAFFLHKKYATTWHILNHLYSRVVFQFISWLQRVLKFTQSLNQPKSRNRKGFRGDEKEKERAVLQKQLNKERIHHPGAQARPKNVLHSSSYINFCMVRPSPVGRHRHYTSMCDILQLAA